MSRAVGMVAVPGAGVAGAQGLAGDGGVSDRTQELIDDEVRVIIGRAYDAALALLLENRARLDALAQALIERETLDEAAAYAAADVEPRKVIETLSR